MISTDTAGKRELDWDSYPTDDGEPMAESVEDRDQMIDLIFTIQTVVADRTPVYVSGNEILYSTPGWGRDHVSPDVFVAFGVPQERSGAWKVEETGTFPRVIFEISSPSTIEEDLGKKRDLYERLGVKEYYLFDPSQAMRPPFLAYFRRSGHFVVHEPLPSGSVFSPLLGVELRPVGSWLRVIDPVMGRPLLGAEQQLLQEVQARREAEERAAAEEQARRAAQLQAEVAREQAKAAQEQAEAAQERVVRESQARFQAEERATAEEQARLRAEERARIEEWARREAEERASAEEQARRTLADTLRQALEEVARLRQRQDGT